MSTPADNMGIDLIKVFKELNDNANPKPLHDALSKEATAGQTLAHIVSQAVPDAIQAHKDRLQQQVQEGNQIQADKQKFGADTSDPNSALSVAMSGIGRSVGSINSDVQKIEKVANTSFWQNPIDYIAGHMVLPGYQDDLKRHVTELQAYRASAASINGQFQSTAQTEHTIATATTQKDAADSLQLFADQANIKAQDTSLQALGVSADALKTMQLMKMDAIKNKLDAVKSMVALRGAKEAETRNKLLEDLRQQQLSDKQSLQDSLNRGSDLFNIPHISISQVSSNKDAKDILQSAGNTGQWGDSPGEAGYNLNKIKNNVKSNVKSFLTDLYRQSLQSLTATTSGTIHKDNIVSTMNSHMYGYNTGNQQHPGLDSVMRKDMSVPPPGFQQNIYTVPDLPTIVHAYSAANLQTTPFYKSVIEPLLQNSSVAPIIRSNNPQQLLAIGMAAVDAGKLSPDQLAQGMANIYTAGIHYNNVVNKYSAAGLNPQLHYNVGGIDWTDPKAIMGEITSPFNRHNVSKTMNELGNIGGAVLHVFNPFTGAEPQ